MTPQCAFFTCFWVRTRNHTFLHVFTANAIWKSQCHDTNNLFSSPWRWYIDKPLSTNHQCKARSTLALFLKSDLQRSLFRVWLSSHCQVFRMQSCHLLYAHFFLFQKAIYMALMYSNSKPTVWLAVSVQPLSLEWTRLTGNQIYVPCLQLYNRLWVC